MHAKKIVLLPKEATETRRPIDSVLNGLEREMIDLLDQNVAADAKLTMYNSLFNRFRKLTSQRNEPYKLQILEPVEQDISDKEILEGIPDTKLSNANLLLKFIQKTPNIQITENGEIIVDGNKIYGSNIIDLVHDLSRQRKTHAPAIGIAEIARALKKANVPIQAIGNKERLEYFGVPVQWEE